MKISSNQEAGKHKIQFFVESNHEMHDEIAFFRETECSIMILRELLQFHEKISTFLKNLPHNVESLLICSHLF